MSAGEILRNYPDTFWLIHNCGRLAERNQAVRTVKANRKSHEVVEVKIRDTRKYYQPTKRGAPTMTPEIAAWNTVFAFHYQ